MANSFKAWEKAARKYAAKHPEFDMWPFQINRMASDIAWRYEGCEITPDSVQEAYEDWISGQSPYSPHTVPLEGEDLAESIRRYELSRRDEIFEDAVSTGMNKRLARKFADTIDVQTYYDVDIAKKIDEWFAGVHAGSPYHVPFDEVNMAEREERRALVRSQRPDMSDFSFAILYRSKHSADTIKAR